MLAARTGLSPVMVGRAAELARLRELAATTGEPAVALISGEAGIGKTRLVAERLFLSPRTVSSHLRSIYHKIGAGSRAAASRFAAEQGLV